MTTIEWTQRTWNPSTGCDQVSPGCGLPLPGAEDQPHGTCYALTMSRRLKAMGNAKYQRDGDPRTSGPGFGFTEHPAAVLLPLRWKTPSKVFVNSMSDLFHAHASREFLARVFAVMALTPQHTYQVLTKRPLRMRRILSDETFWVWVLAAATEISGGRCGVFREVPTALGNVWLGTSVEGQKEANERVVPLLQTPAAVRFLSCEPLLGPVDLHWCAGVDSLEPDWNAGMGAPHPLLDWVIVGGESGRGARPMDWAWAQRIVDDCHAAGVPVFVKQLGSVLGGKSHHNIETFPRGLQYREYPAEVHRVA